MANYVFQRGFMPVPSGDGDIQTLVGDVGATAVFIGSPIKISSGLVVPSDTAGEDTVKGVIVTLRDSHGNPVTNVPDSTTGYKCEYTYQPYQVYEAYVNGSDYLFTDGKVYGATTAEGSTAAADGLTGSTFSSRKIDSLASSVGSSSTAKQWVVLGKTQELANASQTAGTKVWCRITPEAYQN